MSESERPSYHHGDLRAALIEAAGRELAENGPAGFSLRACARRAGVSHAAPKHHFGSAEGLLDVLAARGFRQLTEAMEEETAEREGTERLLASGRAYVRFARDHPALFKLMFAGRRAGPPGEELAAAGTAAFAVLSCNVAGAARGVGDGETALDIAAAWSIVHGLAHLLIEAPPAMAALLGPGAPDEAVAAVLARPLPVGRAGSAGGTDRSPGEGRS